MTLKKIFLLNYVMLTCNDFIAVILNELNTFIICQF